MLAQLGSLLRHVAPVRPGHGGQGRLMAALEASAALAALPQDDVSRIADATCEHAGRLLDCDRVVLWAVHDGRVEVLGSHPASEAAWLEGTDLFEGLPEMRRSVQQGPYEFCVPGPGSPGPVGHEVLLERLGAEAAMQIAVDPLDERGRRLCFLWDEPCLPPTATEVFIGHQLARAAAAALDAAGRAAELERIEADLVTVGRALAPPDELAAPAGFRVAHWLPERDAAFPAEVIELIQLRDRTSALVVAHVEGHGPATAAATALARHVARGACLALLPPRRVVELVNEALVEAGQRSSLLVARIQRRADRARVLVALGGHPFPLVRFGDGPIAEVHPRSELLGVRSRIEVAQDLVVLRPGDVFVVAPGSLAPVAGAPRPGDRADVVTAVASAGPTADEVVASLRRAAEEHPGRSTADPGPVVALELLTQPIRP